MRRAFADVGDGVGELRFGAERGVVGDLRFVRADEIRRRIDDRAIEFEDRARRMLQMARKLRRLGIEPDAYQ